MEPFGDSCDRTTKKSLVVASVSNSLLEKMLRRRIRMLSGVDSNTSHCLKVDCVSLFSHSDSFLNLGARSSCTIPACLRAQRRSGD